MCYSEEDLQQYVIDFANEVTSLNDPIFKHLVKCRSCRDQMIQLAVEED